MQPKEIAGLDPHYAHEMGFQTHEAIRGLHQAAARLGEIADRIGQPVTEESLPILSHVLQCLALEAREDYLAAKLLRSHDSFITEKGRTVPSRLLVVDARSSAYELADEAGSNPFMCVRAYFLLLGDSSDDSTEVLPYYVVSGREIGESNAYEAQHTHVFANRFMADLPLDAPQTPRRVHDIEPYVVMRNEMEIAIDCHLFEALARVQ